MHDLSSMRRDCLQAIAALEEPSGSDIIGYIENLYGADVYHSRIYPNLDKLVNKGLVIKEEADARTNKYMLTNRGEREVQEQAHNWTNAVEDIEEQ